MLYLVEFWGLADMGARNRSVLEKVVLHHGSIDPSFWKSVERVLGSRKKLHFLIEKWLKRKPCDRSIGLKVVVSEAAQDPFTGEVAVCGASYSWPA